MANIKNHKRKSNDELLQTIKENKALKQYKNKERIDSIREDFKNLSYKLPKSELKDIESTLYTIEKTKKISTKKTSKYLDKLDYE